MNTNMNQRTKTDWQIKQHNYRRYSLFNPALKGNSQAGDLCLTEIACTRFIGLKCSLRVCGKQCCFTSLHGLSQKVQEVLQTHAVHGSDKKAPPLPAPQNYNFQSIGLFYSTPTEQPRENAQHFDGFSKPNSSIPSATLIGSDKYPFPYPKISSIFSLPEGRFFNLSEPFQPLGSRARQLIDLPANQPISTRNSEPSPLQPQEINTSSPTHTVHAKQANFSASQKETKTQPPDYLHLLGIRTLAEPECNDLSIRVRAEQIWSQKCPECGCDSRDFRPNGTRQQIILDEPRGLKSVKVHLRRRSYKCRACGMAGLLPLDCLVNRRGMTRRLLDYLEKESLLRPFREVALEVGLSPKTVREIFWKRVQTSEITTTTRAPRVLGIDGVYIKRKDRAILTDLENREVIDIQESTTAAPLTKSLKQLVNRNRTEIIVMDMDTSLKSAVEENFPAATIVIDRYHIQRMANAALDKVRRRLRSAVKPRMCKRSLLRKHPSQRNAREEAELKMWFGIKPGLQTAYDLKEMFFDIWNTACKATAEENYRQWLDSIPPEFRKDFKELITAMNNWREYIFNYFDYRYTNAFTESTNRRIKDIQREARNGEYKTVRAKAIYGTIVRKQLNEARKRQAKPTRNRAKTAEGVLVAPDEALFYYQQTLIQMALF